MGGRGKKRSASLVNTKVSKRSCSDDMVTGESFQDQSQEQSLITIASVNDGSEVQRLKLEICSLNQTITVLSTKLNFVLSFLGIDEQCRGATSNGLIPADVNADANAGDGHVTRDVELDSLVVPPVKSYSDAARVKLVDSVKKEVMSAVHVELDLRTKRSTNVVIHGLPAVSGTTGSDLDHVKDFLNVEFCSGDQPFKVVSCRRLGSQTKVTNTASTVDTPRLKKFQPLLVTLDSSQQAKYLIDNAKKLRKSHCQYTRDSIFINPDMTAAESKAAYEQRCKRREKLAAVRAVRAAKESARGINTEGGGHGATTSAVVDEVVTAFLSDVRFSIRDQSAPSSSQPNSSLDPSIEPFHPRSSDEGGAVMSSMSSSST